MCVLLLPQVSLSIKGREKATVTKPIIFTYPLLPASRHVILNAVGDPGAASESWENMGFADEAVIGNYRRTAAKTAWLFRCNSPAGH